MGPLSELSDRSSQSSEGSKVMSCRVPSNLQQCVDTGSGCESACGIKGQQWQGQQLGD
jgi:hypothetical protein